PDQASGRRCVMPSEMPIGLSRLRGDSAVVDPAPVEPVENQSRVSGWSFPAQPGSAKTAPERPAGLSLLRAQSVPKPLAAAAAVPASAQTPAGVEASIDKGQAMELMLELSQLLLQERDPRR